MFSCLHVCLACGWVWTNDVADPDDPCPACSPEPPRPVTMRDLAQIFFGL